MKASHAIAAEVRGRIARGDLRAGQPLPVENELTEQFGVSKPVVREALRILEVEGLVEVRRGIGGGPRVRHPSIIQAATAMGIYLQIGDVLVLDVVDARDRIIAGAVERLAAAGAGLDLSPLQRVVDDLSEQIGEVEGYYLLLIEAGEIAVRLAGNATESALVVALRHIVATELQAATNAVVDVEVAAAIESEVASAWRRALAAIVAGDAPAARTAYEDQAQLVRAGLAEATGLTEGVTVVDIIGRSA